MYYAIREWQKKLRLTNIKKLEFMFVKQYAPNTCEPSIEAIVKMGVRLGEGGGGVG